MGTSKRIAADPPRSNAHLTWNPVLHLFEIKRMIIGKKVAEQKDGETE
jgi:hypothetical protein